MLSRAVGLLLLVAACAREVVPEGAPVTYDLLLQEHRVGAEERWAHDEPDGGRAVALRRRYRVRVGGREVTSTAREQLQLDARGGVRSVELVHEGRRDVARWDGDALVVTRDGQEPVRHPLSEPPHLLGELPARVLAAAVHDRVRTIVLDATTLAPREAWVWTVDGQTAWRMGAETGTLRVDAHGALVEAESGGVRRVRAPRPGAWEPVDLLAVLGRPVAPIANPRSAHTVVLDLSGAEGAPGLSAPPLQRVDGRRVKIQVPLREEIARAPIREHDPRYASWLEPSPGVQVGGATLAREVERALRGVSDRRAAVEALVRHVSGALDIAPVAGPPSALRALSSGRGDCNEHAALLIALSRTAGIPARPVAGLVYLEVDGRPGLYLHAWAELMMGEPAGWVPVDPLLGQAIADATHLRLVEGDPHAQRVLLALLPDLGVQVVEVR